MAHAIIAPETVLASACCQECEAKETACYRSCEQMSHVEGDDDSLYACYDKCDYDLYDGAHACWAHCTYCSPPPQPPKCFASLSWHESYEVCQRIEWNPEVEEFECVEWEWRTDHQFYIYEIFGGNCW